MFPYGLEDALEYNPETGDLTWLVSRGRVKKGSRVQSINDKGYYQLRYAGKLLRAHRVAFYLMEGRWPTAIDHINGDRSDNRWLNLREAAQCDNMRNLKRPHTNTSGVVGVSYAKGRDKWQATISVQNKTKHLGYYAAKQDAVCARKAAEVQYGFHTNHGKTAL